MFVGRAKATGQRVANIQHLFGHNGALADAISEYGKAVRALEPVPKSLLELAILRMSCVTGCAYPLAQHVHVARSIGVTETQLRGVADWEAALCFDELERLVLRAVDEIEWHAGMSQETATALAGRLSERDLVELVAFISFYGMLIRFMRSFDVPIDAWVSGTWEEFWPFRPLPEAGPSETM